MLRRKHIYIPLLIESRATSCHAIAAMLRLWETLLPLGNSYPIQHALTYFPNDPTPTICSPMHTITHHLIENKNKESNQIPKQKKTKKTYQCYKSRLLAEYFPFCALICASYLHTYLSIGDSCCWAMSQLATANGKKVIRMREFVKP